MNDTDFERFGLLMLDEFGRVHQEFRRVHDRFDAIVGAIGNITSELADIHRRIDALEEAVGNVAGFAKEIDHVLKRVAEIEKHLGLTTSILA